MDASALFDNPPLDDALRSHKDLEPSQFQFHRLPLEIAELVLEEYAMSASVGEAARSRRVNRTFDDLIPDALVRTGRLLGGDTRPSMLNTYRDRGPGPVYALPFRLSAMTLARHMTRTNFPEVFDWLTELMALIKAELRLLPLTGEAAQGVDMAEVCFAIIRTIAPHDRSFFFYLLDRPEARASAHHNVRCLRASLLDSTTCRHASWCYAQYQDFTNAAPSKADAISLLAAMSRVPDIGETEMNGRTSYARNRSKWRARSAKLPLQYIPRTIVIRAILTEDDFKWSERSRRFGSPLSTAAAANDSGLVDVCLQMLRPALRTRAVDSTMGDAVYAAACAGSMDTLRQILWSGWYPRRDQLEAALVHCPTTEVYALLSTFCAPPLLSKQMRSTALYHATLFNRLDVLRCFLEDGASLNTPVPDDYVTFREFASLRPPPQWYRSREDVALGGAWFGAILSQRPAAIPQLLALGAHPPPWTWNARSSSVHLAIAADNWPAVAALMPAYEPDWRERLASMWPTRRSRLAHQILDQALRQSALNVACGIRRKYQIDAP